MPVVLTIGGSDSSGGAGIQADIKTFATLGVHGTSALTAVTAQNTLGVREVFGLPKEAVSQQIGAILEDFDIGCAKTGMLYSAEIVSLVADRTEEAGISLVLDPVIEAEAGGRLLNSQAISILRQKLIPQAKVVTPNIFEAEALTGVRVKDEESAKCAAEKIIDLGAEAAIITGGHLEGADLLVEMGGVHRIPGEKAKGGNHGVGCTYSASIAAFLARGCSLLDAASEAKQFATASILKSRDVGKGASPVNQLGELFEEADRYRTLTKVSRVVELLAREPDFCNLIPEVGTNVGMAIEAASGSGDVAAVDGRLVKSGQKVHQAGCVRFGASSHVARIILAAMSFDPKMRAAMNVRFSQPLLKICQDMGLRVASFEREHEPSGTSTMSWGTQQAIRDFGRVPDVIWDRGGPGKEPMIRILGCSVEGVANLALEMARLLARLDRNL